MTALLTADTSVVVASLASWHEQHELALQAVKDVRVLPAHVLLEATSVLSRLPHGLAQPLSVVAKVLIESFPDDPLTLTASEHWSLLDSLSATEIRGGAVYDGLVVATAQRHDATLLSMDTRAAATYRSLGASVRWLIEA